MKSFIMFLIILIVLSPTIFENVISIRAFATDGQMGLKEANPPWFSPIIPNLLTLSSMALATALDFAPAFGAKAPAFGTAFAVAFAAPFGAAFGLALGVAAAAFCDACRDPLVIERFAKIAHL